MLMKSLLSFTLIASRSDILASALIAQPVCNADNCARAVSGINGPPRSATADCQSFLRATVTPPTVTVTATSVITKSTTTTSIILSLTTSTTILSLATTSTITLTQPSTTSTIIYAKRDKEPEKRQATSNPTAVPAYASPCSNVARYSSICSCVLGTAAIKTTITAATPTTTITVTNTNTQTSTALSTSTIPTTLTLPTATTILITTTITSLSTATATATATQTASSPGAPPPGTPCQTIDDGFGGTYMMNYLGTKTLNPNNPANIKGNIHIFPFEDEWNANNNDFCMAASFFMDQFSDGSAYIYKTFNIFKFGPYWYATAYVGSLAGGGTQYYDVDTQGVTEGMSYGFMYESGD